MNAIGKEKIFEVIYSILPLRNYFIFNNFIEPEGCEEKDKQFYKISKEIQDFSNKKNTKALMELFGFEEEEEENKESELSDSKPYDFNFFLKSLAEEKTNKKFLFSDAFPEKDYLESFLKNKDSFILNCNQAINQKDLIPKVNGWCLRCYVTNKRDNWLHEDLQDPLENNEKILLAGYLFDKDKYEECLKLEEQEFNEFLSEIKNKLTSFSSELKNVNDNIQSNLPRDIYREEMFNLPQKKIKILDDKLKEIENLINSVNDKYSEKQFYLSEKKEKINQDYQSLKQSLQKLNDCFKKKKNKEKHRIQDNNFQLNKGTASQSQSENKIKNDRNNEFNKIDRYNEINQNDTYNDSNQNDIRRSGNFVNIGNNQIRRKSSLPKRKDNNTTHENDSQTKANSSLDSYKKINPGGYRKTIEIPKSGPKYYIKGGLKNLQKAFEEFQSKAIENSKQSDKREKLIKEKDYPSPMTVPPPKFFEQYLSLNDENDEFHSK